LKELGLPSTVVCVLDNLIFVPGCIWHLHHSVWHVLVCLLDNLNNVPERRRGHINYHRLGAHTSSFLVNVDVAEVTPDVFDVLDAD
jgi:hypothetical protein